MIDISIEPTCDQPVLKFDGDLTVENVAKSKALLLDLIEARDHLTLDLTEVETVDVAGLQLLCAAHRAWRQRYKKSVHFRGASEAFRRVARDSGYARREGCIPGDRCLWTGGGTNE